MSSQQSNRSFLNSPSPQSTSTSTSKVLRPPRKAHASKREAKPKSSAEAPPPLPAPINADNLSKYFADIASRIDAAIVRHTSVTSNDRKEIISLAGALKDASFHVTNVMEASTMINNISSTDLITSIRDVVKEEVSILTPMCLNSEWTPQMKASVALSCRLISKGNGNSSSPTPAPINHTKNHME